MKTAEKAFNSPKPIVNLTASRIAAFWSRVDKKGPDECWIWNGVPTRYGYGRFQINGKSHHAHRVAFTIERGPIPENLFACHECDVKLCCNPSHLFPGTGHDNMRDASAKGRMLSGDNHHFRKHPELYARGEAGNTTKLTNEQVLMIRKIRSESGLTYKKIGERFGVTKNQIFHIVKFKQWKHLK